MDVIALSKLNALEKELSNTDKYVQVTNRGGIFDSLSDGSSIGSTFLKRFTATQNIQKIYLVYANYYVPGVVNDEIGDRLTPNAINIKCGISKEYDSDVTPVYFDSQRTIALKPGEFICTDGIEVNLNAGDYFFTRTYVSVDTLGHVWPKGFENIWLTGEGETSGDAVDGGNLSYSADGYFCPVAIIGASAKSSILIMGDSIADGTTEWSNSEQDLGYIMRALSGKYNYINIARGQDLANQFCISKNQKYRMEMAEYCDIVIGNYGRNDVDWYIPLTEIKTELTKIWETLAAKGKKIFWCTITPKTTSTDSWATTGNQTIADAYVNSVRTQLNDWIRTCPAPLAGYFDAADYAESARNSGIWKAGYTDDGLHPNSTGSTAIKSCIDLGLIGRVSNIREIASYNAKAGADVSIAVANTWYTGASITLPPGTYLVSGQITLLRNTTTAVTYSARISDGTNHFASAGSYQTSVANSVITLPLTTVITLAAATTISLQATGNQTATIKVALGTNGVGNNATQLSAIKLS